ncbi:hypothetical protein MET9862_04449 [Methylobacterium symbioticum]|uniref:Uncharacterized protein n=1 Tax=Methylobacterium symbioticum TaxID=2584084 RepID=A0A509EK28_9HYPH|nr:hypothetical protein MET9862_04449 [Methylobacterium symbioticum]
MARLDRPKAAMKPGCQICAQAAFAITSKSRAGSARYTTKRFSSPVACGPSRPVRRASQPARISAKIGSTTRSVASMGCRSLSVGV